MKLYEIKDNYLSLLNMADDLPEEALNDTLESIQEEFKDKSVNVVKIMQSLDANAKCLDDEIKRLQARQKTFKNRSDSLKNYLRQNMLATDTDKIETDLFTLSLRKGSVSTVVEDVEKLPDNVVKISKSADKRMIKKLLESGEEIVGCSLVEGEKTLIIK